MTEINLTPLIDIMLVLLIIFMLATPLLQQSISVKLPQAPGSGAQAQPHYQTVTLTADGSLWLENKPVHLDQIIPALQDFLLNHPDGAFMLQADTQVPYGQVAELIALLKDAGIEHIGLATDPTSMKKSF